MTGLPEEIAAACAPLFAAVPLESAMPRLTGSHPHHLDLVEQVLTSSALRERPEMAAGLWLYVDDLNRSHRVSQSIEGPTGAFWHGIMHRREGDYSNAHYWMRRAASHPLFAEIDPAGLVNAVAAAVAESPDLVQRQRAEWVALFQWCASQP